MSTSDSEAPPVRDWRHEALAIFLGDWQAEGKSYGSPQQSDDDPARTAEPWISTHTARWHTGEFFLIQDERATTGGRPFDTLSVLGVDPHSGRYFLRSFENHGFYRHYDLDVQGNVWSISGERERARITFSPDGRTQNIEWEWRPRERWIPLCDRVARRGD